jgi:site-specific DNA recombinase
MIHNFATKKATHYRYYVCSTVLKNGRSKCPTGSLPAGEIERVVVEQIARIAEDRELQREVFRQARVHHDAEIAALDAERKELDRELARHHAEIRKLATSRSPNSATTGRIADLHEKVRTAEERHREIGGTLAELQAERIEDADMVAAFERFDAVWNALSKREQAAIMSLLLSRVEFDAEASTVAVTFQTTALKTDAKQPEETAA